MTRGPIERRSVPEEIAEVIQDRVMTGDMRPGHRLRETGLAREFGASRNTVREALLLLEARGLLQRIAHRGTKVVEPARSDIREIMDARQVMEPGAVRRLAALSGSERASDRLDGLLETAGELEDTADAGDWKRYGTLDLAFHAGLVRSAGGEALGKAFEALLRPLYVHLLAADRSAPDGPRRHVSEHRRLVRLIAEGAGSEALALIDRHLADAREAIGRSGMASQCESRQSLERRR